MSLGSMSMYLMYQTCRGVIDTRHIGLSAKAAVNLSLAAQLSSDTNRTKRVYPA